MRIELVDVRKRFGSHEVLRGLRLSVPSGARVALAGPNGSGKSTLLRGLMGMLRLEGTIALDGRSPFAEREQVASRLAYVPQGPPQLGATVREVVRVAAELRGLAARDLELTAANMELDLRALADKSFRSLSGGMKQKLLIALAFAGRASLYILDEPTASLDAHARTCFEHLLARLPNDATVLLCSHRLEDVAHFAERALVLSDGRIVSDRSSAERVA